MKNAKQFLFVFILTLPFVSCIKDENLASEANIHTSELINITTNSTFVFNEKNINTEDTSTFQTTIIATLSEPKSVDAIIDFNQTSGTANSDDYNIESITIKAGQLESSTILEIFKTQDIEGDENFTLEATSRANFSVDFEVPVTIENDFINDVLNITTSWDNSYTYDDNGTITTLESCNEIDLDVYLYDLDYNYITTIAESSDCPEIGSISGLEDGNYMIGIYLYDSSLSSYKINQTLPLTITYSQDEIIEETSFINVEFSTDDAWDDYKEVIVAEIEVKNGYLYTITPL